MGRPNQGFPACRRPPGVAASRDALRVRRSRRRPGRAAGRRARRARRDRRDRAGSRAARVRTGDRSRRAGAAAGPDQRARSPEPGPAAAARESALPQQLRSGTPTCAATTRRPPGSTGRSRRATASLWGAYRNLFSGVTTVAHHGPLQLRFLVDGSLPVRLRLPMACAESLLKEPDVESRARHARARMPFAIHLAEGVDETARRRDRQPGRAGRARPGDDGRARRRAGCGRASPDGRAGRVPGLVPALEPLPVRRDRGGRRDAGRASRSRSRRIRR